MKENASHIHNRLMFGGTMFKKILFLFSAVAMALSACGTLEVSIYRTPSPDPLVAAPTLTPAQSPLSMDSSSETIRQKMLHSALNWRSIWLDGIVTTNLANPPEIVHQQVWIDPLQARFRFLSGPAGGDATNFKVSDGISILAMDIASGQTQMSAMPDGTAGQFVPELVPDSASPNPLWGQMGERLAGMAFPSDYAQNQGVFKPFGIELVAERQALAVEWTYIKNTHPSWRMWLDVQTGVILKMQDFGKGGGDTVENEYLVTQVLYDLPDLPAELFSVNPAQAPAFSDVAGIPLTSAAPGPVVQAGTDPLGEVYFFALAEADVLGARLLRLPGSCVAGEQDCPAPEQIPLPGKAYANNSPVLAWSADGKKVAFVASIEDIQVASLYISAVPDVDWKQVVRFALLDLPSWSGDGNWLSFRAQDANGNLDYYVVRADGSDLKNITASDKLPAEGRPYTVDAWIGNNLLLRSGKPGQEASAYLLRVDDMHVKPLFNAFTRKAAYFPSPDGSLLAFDEYNDQSSLHTLRLIAPDGSGLRDLASFNNTIYPIIWSPDGNFLAFTVYGNPNDFHPIGHIIDRNGHGPKLPNNGGQRNDAVYVIGRDGRGLKQFSAGTAVNLAFSPDGHFLLIEDAVSRKILVADLNSLSTHVIKASSLSLADSWRQPAWVP
jgi:hypothetical protein